VKLDPAWRLAECVDAIRGPSIVSRVFDHAGADRILLDVSETCQPIALVEDGDGTVSTVPDRSDSLVLAVVVTRVSMADGFHRPRQGGRGMGRRHQMVVVIHQHKRMNGHVVPGRRAFKKKDEPLVVDVLAEDRAAIEAAVDDVIAGPWNEQSSRSRHGHADEQDSFALETRENPMHFVLGRPKLRTDGSEAVEKSLAVGPWRKSLAVGPD
jgi:hypothetical protein